MSITREEYQETAISLESKTNDAAKVQIDADMAQQLMQLVATGRAADIVKRLCFYEKKPDIVYGAKVQATVVEIATLLASLQVTNKTFAAFSSHRLLHAVLGKLSEAGEMMESLIRSAASGKPIDLDNFREEFGDDEWYGALGRDELYFLADANTHAFSQESIQEANLAKLNVRYRRDEHQQYGGERDIPAEQQAMKLVA